MGTVPSDTLKLAKGLEEGGFTADQARAAVQTLADAASTADLATKADLTILEQRITTESEACSSSPLAC